MDILVVDDDLDMCRMMTAHRTDELSERSLRKGVAMMLAKPLDFERLLTLVKFAEMRTDP